MATVQAEPTVFLWQGRDKRGTKLKGQQIAANPNLVRAELRRQGINPISVKRKPKPLFGGAGSRISAKDVAVFSRQLATMLKSGVPLVTAMQIMGFSVGAQRIAKGALIIIVLLVGTIRKKQKVDLNQISADTCG